MNRFSFRCLCLNWVNYNDLEVKNFLFSGEKISGSFQPNLSVSSSILKRAASVQQSRGGALNCIVLAITSFKIRGKLVPHSVGMSFRFNQFGKTSFLVFSWSVFSNSDKIRVQANRVLGLLLHPFFGVWGSSPNSMFTQFLRPLFDGAEVKPANFTGIKESPNFPIFSVQKTVISTNSRLRLTSRHKKIKLNINQIFNSEQAGSKLNPADFLGRKSLAIPLDFMKTNSERLSSNCLLLKKRYKHMHIRPKYPLLIVVCLLHLILSFFLLWFVALFQALLSKLFSLSPLLLCILVKFSRVVMSYKAAVIKSNDPKNASITAIDRNPSPEPISQSHNQDVEAQSSNNPVDKISQVQKDAEEFANSCLFAKILGTSVDLKTIISKTKLDWKMVKGDIDYLEMGNGWIMLRFANPQDRFLVWSERPWHVIGQLLVLIEWEPLFDPFIEEIINVDLWIRIHRIPVEMINHECVAWIVENNDVGKLVRLDQRSLVRNKIRFARAVISVNINETLKSCVEISCADGRKRRLFIWYEDFSEGCAHCAEMDHSIDDCPLLITPPKEVKITIQKAPSLLKTNVNYSMPSEGEKTGVTTAQSAYVVHPKPKQKAVSISENSKRGEKEESSAKQKQQATDQNDVRKNLNTTLDENLQVKKADEDKGQKLKIASPLVQLQTSKDEGEQQQTKSLNTPKPSIRAIDEVPCSGEFAPPTSDLPVVFNSEKKIVHELAEKILRKQPNLRTDLRNRFEVEKNLDEKGSFLSDSPSKSDDLLSASSEQSIIRQIKEMEVEQPLDADTSVTSSSAKKRGEMEDDETAASSSLKRSKK